MALPCSSRRPAKRNRFLRINFDDLDSLESEPVESEPEKTEAPSEPVADTEEAVLPDRRVVRQGVRW